MILHDFLFIITAVIGKNWDLIGIEYLIIVLFANDPTHP